MFGMFTNVSADNLVQNSNHGGTSKIGTPRIKRTIKVRNFDENRKIEELQFQVCVAIPSKSFDSKADMCRIFEEIACGQIRDIHLETMKLELAGNLAGYVVENCIGK